MRGKGSGQHWLHYSGNSDCSDNVNSDNKDGNYPNGGNHGGVTGSHYAADSSGFSSSFSGVCL